VLLAWPQTPFPGNLFPGWSSQRRFNAQNAWNFFERVESYDSQVRIMIGKLNGKYTFPSRSTPTKIAPPPAVPKLWYMFEGAGDLTKYREGLALHQQVCPYIDWTPQRNLPLPTAPLTTVFPGFCSSKYELLCFPPLPPTFFTITMINSNVSVDGSTYTSVEVTGGSFAINAIVPPGYTFTSWTIVGGGTISSSTLTVTNNVTVTANYISNPMIIILSINQNSSIKKFDIPILFVGAQTVDVDWGDGAVIRGYNANNLPKHTYNPTAPTLYTVKITGTASGYGGGPYTGASLITEVVQWGTLGMTKFPYAFPYATLLTKVPSTFVPNVTDVNRMFVSCTNLNCDISNWDVSTVTDMSEMFRNASKFNSNISSWSVGRVTKMTSMFSDASSFNQPLDNWIVSSVTDMGDMFSYAVAFNKPLNNWNVTSVTTMSRMFANASAFNQNINRWNVANVGNATNIFFNTPMCGNRAYWPSFKTNIGVTGCA